MTHFDPRQADIDLLNAFLCREHSAHETYGMLLGACSNEQICRAIARLRNSQQERIDELERRIQALAGVPLARLTVWRTLSRVRKDSDGRLSNAIVIFALEEYSRRMLRAYRRSLADLSPETRKFIERNILPQSQLVHRSVVSLEAALRPPSGVPPSGGALLSR